MNKLKSTFTSKLLFFMVGFGLIIGIIFPFFVKFFLRLPADKVLRIDFFSLCILAGLIVGGFNFFVFKSVFYNFLETISEKMTSFQEKLSNARREEAIYCDAEECFINIKSNDPIVGNITNSFNTFIRTIQDSMKAELITSHFLDDLKKGLSVRDIADVVLDAFTKYFGAEGGCILGYDYGTFEILKSKQATVDLELVDQDELYAMMEGKESILFEQLHKNPLQLNIVVGKIVPRSIAFIPLKYQNQGIGVAVLLAQNTFSREFNTLESRNFIKQATPFLHNSSLIKRLETLAAIDELTRVYNRRFGIERLTEEFSRAQRFASSFSLCMLDLDHFKNINDTFGHQAGDQVLKNLAAQLQKDLRSSDFIVRYGGEEFLVVLPGASMADASRIMDRIRRRVENHNLEYGSYTIQYTFSGGICSYPSKNINEPNDLIRFADEALYRAKDSGRNCIVMASED